MNKYYVHVAEAILCLDDVISKCGVDVGLDIIIKKALPLHWHSINRKSAMVAVLACGTVVDDTLTIPDIQDILSKYRYIRKRVSNKKPVYMRYCINEKVEIVRIL